MPARPSIDSTCIVRSADVLEASLGNETVLLNLRDGVYYGLADVAARIWTLVRQPVALRSVHDAIVDEFDVDPARCASDLAAFVEDLAAHGLVEVRSAP